MENTYLDWNREKKMKIADFKSRIDQNHLNEKTERENLEKEN